MTGSDSGGSQLRPWSFWFFLSIPGECTLYVYLVYGYIVVPSLVSGT